MFTRANAAKVLVPVALFLAAVGVYFTLLRPASPLGNSSPAASPSAEELAQGKAIYDQYCAACHGIDGEGQPGWQRPNSAGVYPAPPHTGEGHTWHHPDDVLLDIIANGGAMPASAMPGFADHLTEEEMRLVLAYLKTFWGPNELRFQREVSRNRER
jgi:mono/diheme cytochrome c family protein